MNTHDIKLPPLPPADRYFEFDSHSMKASVDIPYWGEKSLEVYARAAIEADRKQRHLKEQAQLNQEWAALKGMQAQYEADLQSQDREDAARFKFLRDNAQLFSHFGDIGNSGWCVMRRDHTITRVFTYNGKELAEAIDHARRIEREGE